MNSFLQQLRAFFENLAPRERLLVSAVGALLLLTLLWFGVVQRAIAFADSVEERVAIAEQQLRARTESRLLAERRKRQEALEHDHDDLSHTAPLLLTV